VWQPSTRGIAGQRLIPLLLLVGLTLCGCARPEKPPALATALALRGSAAERAQAFARVAIEGDGAERRRAGFLWGLFACDAGAPRAGLSGFAVASPTGGRAKLAARRLEEALAAAGADEAAWRAAIEATWLPADERSRLAVRAAGRLLERGAAAAASRLLPDPAAVRGDERARALGVRARAGQDGAAAAARALAVEFPHRVGTYLPGTAPSSLTASFSIEEWAAQARAWLDAGEPAAALGAARRAGPEGALLGAQAALRLRRSSEALAWATRLGDRSAEGWVERADAYRQIAWGGPREQRARHFAESLRCTRQAAKLAGAGSPLAGRIALQHGEALSELGQAQEAGGWLVRPEAAAQPRWEWVARRFVYLQGQRGRADARVAALPWGTTRGRRLAAYWQARLAGGREAFAALVDSGFPDLPAQWASQGRGVPVTLAAAAAPLPEPPPWAADLLAVGRIADAVVAWRADLEASTRSGPAWLGVLALGELPPLDAIPLLVRGEPRLTSGPWTGLSRELLERYLPLPWRAEVEAAAARARIPPWVLAGLVRQESAWNPRAVSSAGAVGLTQLLPSTARELVGEAGLPPSWGRNLTDPGANLAIGALLLSRWRQGFGGSWPPTLACYNAGERRVREVWERSGRRAGPEFVEALEIPETHDYVHRVALLAEGYRLLYWPEGKATPWT
jgi:soluble lytic murein transglycosylase-like protein